MRCQIRLVHPAGNAFRVAVVAGIGDPGRAGLDYRFKLAGSPMPATNERVHKHLRRLERVWID
jgi:hypothetical protein